MNLRKLCGWLLVVGSTFGFIGGFVVVIASQVGWQITLLALLDTLISVACFSVFVGLLYWGFWLITTEPHSK